MEGLVREVEARREAEATGRQGSRIPFGETRLLRLWSNRPGAVRGTRAILRDLRRPRGELLGPKPDRLVVRQSGRRLSLGKLHGYRTLMGYPEGEEIPATLPESLFVPLIGKMIAEPAFPMSSRGLVAVAADFNQRRPLTPQALLELRCEMAELRQTFRGIELDMALHAEDDQGGEWSGTTTWLSPCDNAWWQDRDSTRRASKDGAQSLSVRGRLVELPLRLGRRYAELSGDFAPEHLHPLAVRAVGFESLVAHNMWVLGRAISHVGTQHQLGDSVSIQAQFTRPVPLPGRIAIQQRERASDARTPPIDFEVTDPASRAPHLVGQVRAIAGEKRS